MSLLRLAKRSKTFRGTKVAQSLVSDIDIKKQFPIPSEAHNLKAAGSNPARERALPRPSSLTAMATVDAKRTAGVDVNRSLDIATVDAPAASVAPWRGHFDGVTPAIREAHGPESAGIWSCRPPCRSSPLPPP